MIASTAASSKNYYSTENNCIPVDWPLIWARKFRKDLNAFGKTGRGYTPVIKEFIGTLHRPPKYTPAETVAAFIQKAHPGERECCREAPTIFFTTTVPVGFPADIIKSSTFKEPESSRKITDTAKLLCTL